MGVGYAVLVEWPNRRLKITCNRVCKNNADADFPLVFSSESEELVGLAAERH
jgi:hypothetical protein